MDQNVNAVWEIHTRNVPTNFKRLLEKHDWVTEVKELAANTFHIEANSASEAEKQLAKAIGATDAQLISIEPVDSDLEHAFLKLTQSGGNS